jgi:hypothetical protein
LCFLFREPKEAIRDPILHHWKIAKFFYHLGSTRRWVWVHGIFTEFARRLCAAKRSRFWGWGYLSPTCILAVHPVQQGANIILRYAPILPFAPFKLLVVDSSAKSLKRVGKTERIGPQIIIDVSFN